MTVGEPLIDGVDPIIPFGFITPYWQESNCRLDSTGISSSSGDIQDPIDDIFVKEMERHFIPSIGDIGCRHIKHYIED